MNNKYDEKWFYTKGVMVRWQVNRIVGRPAYPPKVSAGGVAGLPGSRLPGELAFRLPGYQAITP